MSRPPKTAVDESDETIYSPNPTYDPIEAVRKASQINDNRHSRQAAATVVSEEPQKNQSDDTEGRELPSPSNANKSNIANVGGIEWFADVAVNNDRNTIVYRDGERDGDDDDHSLRVRREGNDNGETSPLIGKSTRKGRNEADDKSKEEFFLDKSFLQAALLCCRAPAAFLPEWTHEMRDTLVFSYNRARNLTLKEILLFLAFLFILTSTQLCAVFGFNFWLHNFAKGSATYVSIVVPSVIYAVVNLLLIPVFKYRQKPGESLLFWTDSKESVLMLIAIGLADSVSGMTATYAVPHIPVIVQTSVSSCGAIFVYILHRFLYKKTALPFSFLLLVCFTFLIVSVVLSVAPLYLNGRTDTYIEGRWVGVYMFVIISPAIYNVVQGRFLGKYVDREDVPKTTSKFVVLTGDYWVQALVSFAYFPLDFMPGFGPSPDAEHAWGKAKDALACIRDCEYNWIYLTLYVFGFWSGRVLRTVMNMYSPTMGQFVMQLMGPIKAFAIVLFPALNLKGNKSQNPAYNAGTFGALIIATLFYLLANEQQRMKVERRKAREAANEEEERVRNERGAVFLNTEAKGLVDYAKGYDENAYVHGAASKPSATRF